MTVKYGFYNSLNSDRLYDANDVGTMLEGIFSDGVFEHVGDCFEATNYPGRMNVIVGSGRASFKNLWIRNTSAFSVGVPPSHVIYDRIDLVILEFNSDITVRQNAIKLLAGTPSATPIPPTLTNTDTLNQYAIAEVLVPAGSTQIEQVNITSRIGTVNTPYAKSLIGEASTGREILTSDRTYYVRTDGNDSNDGLTNASNGAFLTIQKGIDTFSKLDTDIYNVILQIEDGTYNEDDIELQNCVGNGSLTLRGNLTSPANVVIDARIKKLYSGSEVVLEGFKLQKTTSTKITALLVQDGANVIFNNLIFGTNWTYHVNATVGGRIRVNGSYTIAGNATTHILLSRGGMFSSTGAYTITLTNTPTWVDSYINCGSESMVQIASGTIFSGSSIGSRFNISFNGVIDVGGKGRYFLPGNAEGTIASGGVYDGYTEREVLRADRTYYVRKDGSDTNSGLLNTSAGAFLTIAKVNSTIATIDKNGFNITVQLGTGTWNETITPKSGIGDGRVIWKGTLSLIESFTSATVSAGSGFTFGTVTKTGQFTGDTHKGSLAYFVTDNDYRIIQTNTNDVLTLCGTAPSSTTQNISIYTWGTIITSFISIPINIEIQFIHFDGNGGTTAYSIQGAAFSSVFVYYCKLVDNIRCDFGYMDIRFCQLYTIGTGAAFTTSQSNAILYACLVLINTGGTGFMYFFQNSGIFLSGLYIDGDNGGGILADQGIRAGLNTVLTFTPTYGYVKINGCDLGLLVENGSQSMTSISRVQYSACTTNKSIVAASFAYET